MATCFWDLGFDFSAVQKSNTVSFLQNGFVSNGVVAVAKNLGASDTVTFNLFNLTANATVSDGTSILLASLQFTNALTGQKNSSPFSSNQIASGPFGTTSTTGVSSIFNPSPVSPSSPPTTQFPRWTLASLLPVINTGNFLFTATLVVRPPSGNVRIFIVDPEMIVGTGGTG